MALSSPTLSAGCGGVESIFSMSNVSSASSLGLYAPGFTASDTAFAYQVEAGFRCPIAKNFDLGLAYKFLGTTDHSWSDHGVNLSTDGSYTHSTRSLIDLAFLIFSSAATATIFGFYCASRFLAHRAGQAATS